MMFDRIGYFRRYALVMFFAAAASTPAWSQIPGGWGWGRDRGDDNGQSDEERRELWRKRVEEMRTATPDQRRSMELDRMLEFTARSYELDDEQKQTVRAEMEKMSAEYRKSLGEDAEEMDKLRDRMSEYWLQRMGEARPGEDGRQDGADRGADRGGDGRFGDGRFGPWNDPKFRELSQRLRELNEKHPLDWRGSIERIEKLLPPAQVEKARQRREEAMRGMADRAQERLEDMARQVSREPENRELFERFSQMRERMAEWNRRRAEGDEREALTRPQGQPERTSPAAPAPPVHPWDAYLKTFIAKYELDDGQRTAAESILRDAKEREATIRGHQVDARNKAQSLVDSQAKAEALKQLDAPINELFSELKTRLKALLTATQRSFGDLP